ncbi:ATP-binding protein [Pendulispora albinea]|uniref:ATP-dependent DNA helicase RecG C-terminal domain-containing protein n=1 Tax=Pendulispora albinea TaxID=2741071 RepID=A0ABZ2LL91_9BACT
MGPLTRQLDGAWSLVDQWNSEHIGPHEGVRQAFLREYPSEALKEIVRNLVQHRSYQKTNAPSRITWFDDRVEFSNPGGPFGAASESEFGEHSDYRNPGLTERLAELGYVQRLGRGVKLVKKYLAREGHPPLEVETNGFTTLVVRGRP